MESPNHCISCLLESPSTMNLPPFNLTNIREVDLKISNINVRFIVAKTVPMSIQLNCL